MEKIKIAVENLSEDPKEHWNKLDELNKKLQTIMEIKYSNDLKKYKSYERE